ncbi:MAG TPA: hypothetical protein PLT20_08380 [Sedimentisphaerales bacterium]|nr:hypothetical protein [Sedimentisphaerales bacterium]
MICDGRHVVARGFAVGLGILLLALGTGWGQENALMFFSWSDQHVQVDGSGEHLIPAIDAMNTLAG